jgi:hypothetical protein
MKTKLLLFIATIFLLFNSCKKIREKVFSTRMEGKVIDLQTGKGIPNAKLVVYESTGGRLQASRFLPLKTFYADKDGNFKDKIKIAFPDEEDETIEAYYLKAEPDGYEKTEGLDNPPSGTGILPFVNLNLTKANKDLELKCNPEFELSISVVDNFPYFTGIYKNLLIESPRNAGENGYVRRYYYFNNTYEEFKTVFPLCSLIVYIKGSDTTVNPIRQITLDSIPILLNKKTQITLTY